MTGRESEITIWLNNKLGSTDDLWSGISISSRLTKDRLISAMQCFRLLQAHVKVKLLLAFLHVPRRLRDEWKDDLELLYKVACTDGDLWVSMIAEVLRTFPESGDLNVEVKEDHRSYHDMINDLKKMVRQHNTNMLPMESCYLNKASLNSLYSSLPSQLKHFAIKRKPKSAALRVETLQKSADAALKNISSIPVKMRSSAKKMDDDTPLKGLPNYTLSGSGMKSNSLLGRFSGFQGQKRELSNQKEGGIKLLDFDALPLSTKETRKRRKLELEQQKAAKKEEALATPTTSSTSTTTNVSSAMPDYAAGLLAVASFDSLKSSQTSVESSVSLAKAPTTPAPSTTSISLLSPNIIISSNNNNIPPTHQIRFTVVPVNTSAAQAFQQQQQQQFTPIIITQQNRPPQMILTTPRLNPPSSIVNQSSTILNQPSAILIQPSSTNSANLVLRPPGPLAEGSSPVRNLISRIKTLQSPPHQILNLPQQQQPSSTSVVVVNNTEANKPASSTNENPPAEKKEFYLTRDQMVKAQDMFILYPDITRFEKGLILGFMAGARENPCPHQGPVLNIRLGHTTESLQQPDGTFQPMEVDTYLQLNYSNGEFKKLQKIRGKDTEGD